MKKTVLFLAGLLILSTSLLAALTARTSVRVLRENQEKIFDTNEKFDEVVNLAILTRQEQLRRSDPVAKVGAHSVALEEITRRMNDLADRMNDLVLREHANGVFRAIVNEAPNGIFLVREDGEILFANDEAHKMFGYWPGALVGTGIDLLVPESIREGHSARRKAYMNTPRRRPMGSDLKLKAVRADGTLFPVEISLSPVTYESQRCVVTIVRNKEKT